MVALATNGPAPLTLDAGHNITIFRSRIDSLVLLHANERSAQHLHHVLSLYESCSGQTINKEKSSDMFSKNTNEVNKRKFMSALDIRSEARTEKYLGLPIYMGK